MPFVLQQVVTGHYVLPTKRRSKLTPDIQKAWVFYTEDEAKAERFESERIAPVVIAERRSNMAEPQPYEYKESSDIKELRQFVETMARQTKCEEDGAWIEDETPVGDHNHIITCAQADWADELIEEARKLTGYATPQSVWARAVMADLRECTSSDECAQEAVKIVLTSLGNYPDCTPEFRTSMAKLIKKVEEV